MSSVTVGVMESRIYTSPHVVQMQYRITQDRFFDD